MQIRPMVIDDYDAVYSLWRSCAGIGVNNLDDSRQGIETFLVRNPDTCFVADTGEVVGAIMAGNDGRRGYIYHTAVHPDYRGQKIGSALVDSSLKALAEKGIAKVALVVFENNQSGQRFWEKLGFTTRPDIVYRNKALTEIVRIGRGHESA